MSHYDSQPVANARATATALGTTPQTLIAADGASDTDGIAITDTHAGNAAGVVIFRAQNSRVYATGTITLTGLPLNLETFVVGATTYTFKDVLVGANDIKIGATAAATAANIAAAINDSGVEGTNYGTGTTANASATASVNSGVVTLTAILDGTDGNAVVLTEAATNTAVSGAGTLTGGTDLEYFRINTSATASRRLDLLWRVPKKHGLEVLTTGAAGVEVTVFYWTPGATGLGA